MEWIDCNRMGMCKACMTDSPLRTILLTGQETGYIGSNIKQYGNNRRGFRVKESLQSVFVDDFLDACDYKVDAVIHLAAISGVKECEDAPEQAIYTNVMGTLKTIQSCQARGIPVWLASSFAAIQPENLYGYTKAMAEYLTMKYDLGFVFVISNVYGGINFDRKTSVIASWMRRNEKGLPILVHGDGTQERDFIHVQDVARSMVDQIQVQLEGGPSYKKYYLCSGVKTSLNKLYELFESEFKPRDPPIHRPDIGVGI
ncbi:MAG: NAD-dependent epimerase/dehydratase family protein, partial [Aliifodinibius sp.]|nr:SDR family oxidoreductase [Fodinibius sp.]NIY30011.1 NAD-dependent epimerase/dehydratase family protein [Fodinibius sp.]